MTRWTEEERRRNFQELKHFVREVKVEWRRLWKMICINAYWVKIITMHYATVQIGLIQSKLWVHLCSWLARLLPQSIWRRRLLPQFLSRAFLCLQQRLFAPSPPLSGLEHWTATKAHFRSVFSFGELFCFELKIFVSIDLTRICQSPSYWAMSPCKNCNKGEKQHDRKYVWRILQVYIYVYLNKCSTAKKTSIKTISIQVQQRTLVGTGGFKAPSGGLHECTVGDSTRPPHLLVWLLVWLISDASCILHLKPEVGKEFLSTSPYRWWLKGSRFLITVNCRSPFIGFSAKIANPSCKDLRSF